MESRDLEAAIREIIRSWSDRVRSGLERVRPADEARRLVGRYGEAFSAEYRAATDPDVAVQDIQEFEGMVADDRLVSISFSGDRADIDGDDAAEAVGPTTQLKLYLREERLILSDFMPILEQCGLAGHRGYALRDPRSEGPGGCHLLLRTGLNGISVECGRPGDPACRHHSCGAAWRCYER